MLGGTNYSFTVRASAIPTTSWVNGASLTTQLANYVTFNMSFTIGTATAIQAKILFSQDGSTWFTETSANGTSVTANPEVQADHAEYVRVFKASGSYNIAPLNGAPIKAKYATLAVKGVGTLTTSSVSVVGNVGTV